MIDAERYCLVLCVLLCRYMVLFLKFIASVVPTIQYDYTMPVGGAA